MEYFNICECLHGVTNSGADSKETNEMVDYETMIDTVTKLNQQSKPDGLVKIIQEASGLSYGKAQYSALYNCYMISGVLDLWFKDKENDDYGLLEIYKYYFDNGFVDPQTSYQNIGTKKIYERLFDAGIIKPFKYHDEDHGDSIYGRVKTWNALRERMSEDDFHCARVCFGSDDSADHVLIVGKHPSGVPVIFDTSYRSKRYPGNIMTDFISGSNIRWWTEIQ